MLQPVFGETIDAIADAGATAIGIDLLIAYSGETLSPGHDRDLLAALYRHRDKVVLGRSLGMLPAPSLVAALGFQKESLGLLEVHPDADGVHRRVRMGADSPQGPVPSLVSAVLAKAGRPIERDMLLTPRFGPAEIPTFAIKDVLACARNDSDSLRSAFANRIVLIGTTLAEEDRKRLSTRFIDLKPVLSDGATGCLSSPIQPASTPGSGVPGVYVHALAIDAVLSETTAELGSPASTTALATALGFLGAVIGFSVPPVIATTAIVGLGVAVGSLSILLLGFAVWISPAPAMIAVVLAACGAFPVRYLAESQQRRWIQSAFRHYLSPELVDRIASAGEIPKLGGEARDVTVLFCDLRGFTALAEKLSDRPEALVHLMNRVLTALTRPILDHGGTVDKYIGDCVMALWNAPLSDPDHAENAIRAALGMRQAIAELNRELALDPPHASAPADPLAVGIGINSGRAIVGNMGSQNRFDYTAIGDTVNVAARLEALCKTYGVDVILSAATAEKLSNPVTQELDQVTLRGRTDPLMIYTVPIVPSDEDGSRVNHE